MEYRNSSGGVHFGHSIVSNVESSHGVEITGGSTGGHIRPASDDASAALNVRAKGPSGLLNLGTSTGGGVNILGSSVAVTSTHINLVSTRVTVAQMSASSGVTVGSSGTLVTEVRAFTVQFTAPTLSSGIAEQAVESTYTVAGVSTGTLLMFTPTNPINALYTHRARCSTADELVISWGHFGDSTIGNGESTNRGTLIQFRF